MKRDTEHPEAANIESESNHVEDAITNAVQVSSLSPAAPVELFADVEWTFDIGHAVPINVRADKTILPKKICQMEMEGLSVFIHAALLGRDPMDGVTHLRTLEGHVVDFGRFRLHCLCWRCPYQG
eukprot:11903975-Karenia_brevis.AAC.1